MVSDGSSACVEVAGSIPTGRGGRAKSFPAAMSVGWAPMEWIGWLDEGVEAVGPPLVGSAARLEQPARRPTDAMTRRVPAVFMVSLLLSVVHEDVGVDVRRLRGAVEDV